jgi:hypothetical protein
MGVPTSEVGYTSATVGRGDHEVHKGHVMALGEREKNCKCRRAGLSQSLTPIHESTSLTLQETVVLSGILQNKDEDEWSLNSLGGVVTRLWVTRSWKRYLQTGIGAYPALSLWVLRYLSMGLKRPVRIADHSAPHIVYVKNTWTYAATPPLDLMVQSSIIHKNICAYTVT